ncbi:MAG: NUDIX domain-containing protein [Alphaproteobacteria bacterium]|nr:NUDIX domain-containing protein [Alphaproteobacteria bacterium]
MFKSPGQCRLKVILVYGLPMIRIPRFRQCAALPFQDKASLRRVLLITSLGTRRWILPKGNIEPGLTVRESTEFEAFEEAGVMGTLHSDSIGSYTYEKFNDDEDILHHVKVFPLEVEKVLDEYPHHTKRERQWMEPVDAIEAVDEPELKDLIAKFAAQT